MELLPVTVVPLERPRILDDVVVLVLTTKENHGLALSQWCHRRVKAIWGCSRRGVDFRPKLRVHIKRPGPNSKVVVSADQVETSKQKHVALPQRCHCVRESAARGGDGDVGVDYFPLTLLIRIKDPGVDEIDTSIITTKENNFAINTE